MMMVMMVIPVYANAHACNSPAVTLTNGVVKGIYGGVAIGAAPHPVIEPLPNTHRFAPSDDDNVTPVANGNGGALMVTPTTPGIIVITLTMWMSASGSSSSVLVMVIGS